MKKLIGITSTTIGINEWFAPQISEHCPKNFPDRFGEREIWLSRPGVASILIPMAGMVQECSTSDDVVINRVWQLVGIGVELSTSKSRNVLVGDIYESNSMLLKSLYSYLQYHWCPMILIVKRGLFNSSIKYSKWSEGSAINLRIIVGINVHTNSIIWFSRIFLEINLLIIILIIKKETIDRILIIISML